MIFCTIFLAGIWADTGSGAEDTVYYSFEEYEDIWEWTLSRGGEASFAEGLGYKGNAMRIKDPTDKMEEANSPFISVNPGENYKIEAWIKREENERVQVDVTFWNEYKEYKDRIIIKRVGASGWVKVSKTFSIPEGVFLMRFRVCPAIGPKRKGSVLIDEIKIQKIQNIKMQNISSKSDTSKKDSFNLSPPLEKWRLTKGAGELEIIKDNKDFPPESGHLLRVIDKGNSLTHLRSPMIAVKPFHKYRLTMWLRKVEGERDGFSYAEIAFWQVNEKSTFYYLPLGDARRNGKWERLEQEFSIPPTISDIQINVYPAYRGRQELGIGDVGGVLLEEVAEEGLVLEEKKRLLTERALYLKAWLSPLIKSAVSVEFKMEGITTYKTRIRESQAVWKLSWDEIPPGDYSVSASALSRKGEILTENKITVTIPAKPIWLNSKLGEVDKVPTPWTALKYSKDNILSCWGREYKLGDILLPSQIISNGYKLLERQIELSLSTKRYGEIKWTPIESIEKDIDETSIKMQAQTLSTRREFKLDIETKLDYDGFMRFNIILTPLQKREVRSLVLKIPFSSKAARYFSYWPNHWGGAFNTKTTEEQFDGPFRPVIWVGNDEAGLSWCAETNKEWSNYDSNSVWGIVRKKDTVSLEIRYIDLPTVLSHPLNITFALQATPVKPFPDERFNWRVGHRVFYGIENEASPVKDMNPLEWADALGMTHVTFHSDWTQYFGYTQTIYEKELKTLIEKLNGKDIKLLLYLGWGLSKRCKEARNFGQEFTTGKEFLTYGEEAFEGCANTPWQDFLIYGISELLKKFEIRGFYLDGITEPWGCSNEIHGDGYDKEGTIYPTYPVFAYKRLMQRMYTMW